MLASILSFTASAGYPMLFVLVTAESGGIPVPGETALITAAALAGQGTLSIPVVIAVAAAAAIIGDNLGYVLARKYGSGLLQRPGPFLTQRRRALALGEPFFARHGAQAVFFGRWILGLRTWAAWLAGASGMRWARFAFWNAAGAVSWATTIGLTAYLVGQSTAGLFTIFGIVGLSAALFAGGVLLARGRRPKLNTDKKRGTMSSKGDFTQDEWDAVLEGPPSAGMMVVTAQRGGTIRETVAMTKAYAEARQQHGASELLDEIVAAKPEIDHHRYRSYDELKEHSLEHLRGAVEILDRKATADEVEDYRRFVLTLADKVANAHRENGVSVSDAEQAAIQDIARTVGTVAA